jgi:hypothetical protein
MDHRSRDVIDWALAVSLHVFDSPDHATLDKLTGHAFHSHKLSYGVGPTYAIDLADAVGEHGY